jgi:ketosteroid isomerase-like protein
MSHENVAAFWRFMEVFEREDFDAWVESFHPEVDFIPQRAPIQGTFRGHDGIRAFLADNQESFDLFRPEYDDVRAVGDMVVAIGKLRVRGKGSGVEVEVPTAIVLTFRDGKVVRLEDFVDGQNALEAAGLSE